MNIAASFTKLHHFNSFWNETMNQINIYFLIQNVYGYCSVLHRKSSKRKKNFFSDIGLTVEMGLFASNRMEMFMYTLWCFRVSILDFIYYTVDLQQHHIIIADDLSEFGRDFSFHRNRNEFVFSLDLSFSLSQKV